MSGVSVKTKHVVYDFDPWIVLTRDLPSWIFSLKSSNDKILDLETGGSPGSGPEWLAGISSLGSHSSVWQPTDE